MNDERLFLECLADKLHEAVPHIRWQHQSSSRQVIRAVTENSSYRLSLRRRGQFGELLCYGLGDVDWPELLETNSALIGPFRVAQRAPGSRIHFSATWPCSDLGDIQSQCLALGIEQILADRKTIPTAASFDPSLRQWIRDLAKAQDRLTNVPSHDGSYVFIVGTGAESRQLSCTQPHPLLVSIATLAANWAADTRCQRRTACQLITLLNARLKWTRLILREAAINAEVTVPVAALNERTWRLVQHALAQSVDSSREILRAGQLPDVAAAFERIHRTTREDRSDDHDATGRKATVFPV